MARSSKLIVLKIFVVFATVLSLHSTTRANELDIQQWADFNLSVPVAEDLFVGGDLGVRGSFQSQDWIQYIIRPQIGYRVTNWFTPAGGFATFITDNVAQGDVFEFRLYQDANFRVPGIKFLGLTGRFRLEERFFFYEDGNSSWYARARFQVGVQSPSLDIGNQEFYAQVAYEPFATVINPTSSELFIDRARLNFILGHRFHPDWQYQALFFFQAARVLSDDGLEQQNRIFRLRLFYSPR